MQGYAAHIRKYSGEIMGTVSIFKNGNNRAIRLPRDLDFEGVNDAGDHTGRKQHYPDSDPADLGVIL